MQWAEREIIVNKKMVGMLGLESPEEALGKTLIVGDSLKMMIIVICYL